jgi:hypothetical protein
MSYNYTVRCPPEIRSALGSHPIRTPELLIIASSADEASADKAKRRLLEQEEDTIRRRSRESAPTPEPSSVMQGQDHTEESIRMAAIINVQQKIQRALENRTKKLSEEAEVAKRTSQENRTL